MKCNTRCYRTCADKHCSLTLARIQFTEDLKAGSLQYNLSNRRAVCIVHAEDVTPSQRNDSEDEGTEIFRNVCNYLPTQKASHPRSIESSSTPL
jgi:hypothetical protein